MKHLPLRARLNTGVLKIKFTEDKMITLDQLRDVLEREQALRGYL
jgi:hypothetical protein